ncbi:MAG: mechanosensitive ion channel [Gemmatimonadetes bacterium]|nr:mechanosensitive ion channel [Gemmatimonadota bacterium]MCC6771715.1 mechanosensitive ion channel [Gemmatimonadaceae bacterium]
MPVGAAAQAQTEESLTQARASVVRFRGQDLFEVRAPMGKLTPPERARAIEERLGIVASGSADALDAIQVIERERTSDLLAGEQLVLSVTDVDAAPLGRTRQQLAADYAVEFERVMRKEFSGRSLRGVTTALVLTAVATLLFVIAWRALSGFFRRIARLVRSWEGTRITAVHIKGVEFVSATRMTLLAARAVEMLRWLLILIAAVIFLETVLGFFPWTRAAAVEFRAYLWSALSKVVSATVQYLPNLVYITLIVVVVRVVLQGVALVFESLKKGDLSLGGFHSEWAEPTSKIVRILIIAFSVVLVFPYLPGANSPAFQGVSIFLGVLVSFGSTSAVSNVVAGIVMTYMIPFRHGDRVKVGDTVGDIVEMNLLVVRVRTIKNVDVTIPNAAVLGGHIINYSARARDEGLILHSTVTIGYDVPWRTVHQLLTTAASQTTGIAATPPPFVLQTSLDDFYVSYQINAYTDQANRMAALYGELHQNIQDGFAVAGVEIMSPHYRAVRDGGMVTLPSDTLPAGYVSPPIRVSMVPETATAAPASEG